MTETGIVGLGIILRDAMRNVDARRKLTGDIETVTHVRFVADDDRMWMMTLTPVAPQATPETRQPVPGEYGGMSMTYDRNGTKVGVGDLVRLTPGMSVKSRSGAKLSDGTVKFINGAYVDIAMRDGAGETFIVERYGNEFTKI